MNHGSPLPTTAVLRKVKQLAALTSFIRDEAGGCTIDSRESELVGLAEDLAAGIYDHFGNSPSPASATGRAAYGASGKLAAVMTSIVNACDTAMTATSDDERNALAGRIGWLQLNADEIAEELAGHVEQLCAEGAAA